MSPPRDRRQSGGDNPCDPSRRRGGVAGPGSGRGAALLPRRPPASAPPQGQADPRGIGSCRPATRIDSGRACVSGVRPPSSSPPYHAFRGQPTLALVGTRTEGASPRCR
mmetsp:Transcript_36802/g.87432  ORF Transcript_36802/g.87432 Transcript_36802/m.87432 type:complete len:109 (-) Transcript_36802:28-354(-)